MINKRLVAVISQLFPKKQEERDLNLDKPDATGKRRRAVSHLDTAPFPRELRVRNFLSTFSPNVWSTRIDPVHTYEVRLGSDGKSLGFVTQSRSLSLITLGQATDVTQKLVKALENRLLFRACAQTAESVQSTGLVAPDFEGPDSEYAMERAVNRGQPSCYIQTSENPLISLAFNASTVVSDLYVINPHLGLFESAPYAASKGEESIILVKRYIPPAAIQVVFRITPNQGTQGAQFRLDVEDVYHRNTVPVYEVAHSKFFSAQELDFQADSQPDPATKTPYKVNTKDINVYKNFYCE